MDLQTLKDNIISESHRTDQESNLDGFIRRAESRIARTIRAIEMLKPLALVETDRTVADSPLYNLPSDFLEDREVAIAVDPDTNSRSGTLQKCSVSDLRLISLSAPVGWYALRGSTSGPQIEFRGSPAEDSEINGEYFSRIPALVETTDTNLLLENHETLYLSAALFELYRNTQDFELAQAQLDIFTDAANNVDQLAGRYLGGTRVFGRHPIGTQCGGGY
jgi:hypothetical protein